MPAFIFFLFLFIFIGCGEDDNNPTAPAGWQGEFNQSGFPDVIGDYAFITKKINVSCSDGSSNQESPVAFNISISQSVNEITALRAGQGSGTPSGWTIVYSNSLSGLVQKDGDFTMGQMVTADIDGVGRVDIIYTIIGKFKLDEWSGDYDYLLSFRDIVGSCNGQTTFAGDKLTLGKYIESDFEGDIYSLFLGVSK